MTKGMTWASTSIQKFWRRQLRFGFELRPPIAERLEWNPVRFAILSLIQRALQLRLMVLAPESLAVTLTGSKFVGHLVSSLLKIHRREQIASEPRGNKRARNGRLPPCVRNGRLRFLSSKSLIPFENSLFFKIFSLIICVGNCSRSGCRSQNSAGCCHTEMSNAIHFACRDLRRSRPEGREAERASCAGAGQVRVGHKHEDGQGPLPRCSLASSAASGHGNRVILVTSACGTKRTCRPH